MVLGTLVFYPVSSLPLGWKRIDGRGGKPDYMVPHDRARDPAVKAAGIAARNAMEALPKPINQHEIADLIGAPRSIHWKSDGLAYGFRRVGVSFFNVVQVTYFGDTFVLIAPDTRKDVSNLLAEHPGGVIESGEWNPPAGLKIITQAQHDLMLAQWKVALEREGEDVSDV